MKGMTRGVRPVSRADRTHWLALGAVAGPFTFVAAWLALGFVRPGYSIVRQSVSVLGVGHDGDLMNVAFVLGALLLFIGVAGIIHVLRESIALKPSLICAALLALPAVGMLWAGIFNMDHRLLHGLGAGLAFGAPILGFAVVGRTIRRAGAWRIVGNWLLFASPLTLVVLIGFLTSAPLSVIQSVRGGGVLGLWERALIIEVFAWYSILGWRAVRAASSSSGRRAGGCRHNASRMAGISGEALKTQPGRPIRASSSVPDHQREKTRAPRGRPRRNLSGWQVLRALTDSRVHPRSSAT